MKKLLILLTATALTSTSAMAATDGTVGGTSTGTTNVSLDLQAAPAPTIAISGLADLDFGTITASSGSNVTLTGQQASISNICVLLSGATTYALNINSQNAVQANISYLNDAASNSISAVWEYNDGNGTTVTTENSTGLSSGPAAVTCNDINSKASLTLTLPNGGAPFPAGAYSDVLTLTVSPE